MSTFLPFEWIAAVRFLLEGRAQTALTIIGASVGVAVVVFMSALLVAVQANIFTRIVSAQAHVVISASKDEARPLFDIKTHGEIATIQAPAQPLLCAAMPARRSHSMELSRTYTTRSSISRR